MWEENNKNPKINTMKNKIVSKKYQVLIVGFLCSVTVMFSQQITINNVSPRLDTNGHIVDAHDGRLIQFGDTYYWYGTSYGNTNGFTTKNQYVCYSSKDLNVWKKEGLLLPNQPEGVYYRPHVVYNKKTKLYVLWYNWYPKLWNGQFGVATSKNPEGPFKIVNSDVKMFRSDVGLGDFGLFVDDDDTCYLSYNTIQNHQVSVEKLNKNYTASTMENGGIIAEHMEAGTQFKKNGKYYLLTDYTCCFCNYGSGARVYISNNPLSGYTFTNNINRHPGMPSFILNNGIKRGTTYEVLKNNEGTINAVEVQFKEAKSINKITVYQFTGNRPENCGNVENPRVHPEIATPTFLVYKWAFNTWESVALKTTTTDKTALQQEINLTFDEIKAHRIKIVPTVGNDANSDLYLNEIAFSKNNVPLNPKEAVFYITGKDAPSKPIIPAQQSYVTKLQTEKGDQFIWVGDLWGSASDNIKGHDYQYWSSPLQFNDDGTIIPMFWEDSWSFQQKQND